MRSNAGMANRQGDVDLREAQVSAPPPPVNTLAWLGLAMPILYLCVLYLSENKQRLVPLTA